LDNVESKFLRLIAQNLSKNPLKSPLKNPLNHALTEILPLLKVAKLRLLPED
jgi:hypothetical protein